MNNGHNQFSACSSSTTLDGLSNSSSSSIIGSVYTLGTNGGEGGSILPPFFNFKSAAMPDVTKNAKLSKGVDRMQGKRPFNKLFSFLALFFTCHRQFIRRVY
jgi:hypothetical protein